MSARKGEREPGELTSLSLPQFAVGGMEHNYSYHGSDTGLPYQANPTYPQHPGADYVISPQDHHDAYFNEPYQPTATPYSDHEGLTPGVGMPNAEQHPHYWQDDVDTRPILQSDNAYGPDSHQIPTPVHEEALDEEMAYQSPPPDGGIRRWKTVKEVQLFNGNLVLDCPVPPRLLNQIQHAQPPERDEFTHMRYSAATCDPAEFYNDRFTLRQRLFAKPRHTELFIVITMYNEEDELFARTMMGVIKNIEYMNSRTSSKTWGKEAWKKIVVCVVSDGRAKINPRTRAVLAGMGVYQDGIAKQQVNGKDVTAHIYEVSLAKAPHLPSAN